MRLPDSRFAAALALILGAGALPAQVPNGPAADYPVTIGAPYEVEGTTFTPLDTLNYDVVGRAVQDGEGGGAIGAAHHTLPVPCYVEVTALDTGRTILVRIDRRGPMAGKQLIALSPGAAAQLGIAGKNDAPVRVRRVNPPEVERAMLRRGDAAPVRMDTPMGLVGVLKRKLDQLEGKANPPQLAVQTAPVPAPSTEKTAPPSPKLAAEKPKPQVAAKGGYVVQVGAFAMEPNAAKAAKALGTTAEARGRLWRVRLGPFADKASADAALAKARSAGYTDARVQRAG